MKIHTKITIAVLLVALGVLTRFLPHLWNFTAITGIAIFATNYMGIKWSAPIIFASMLISDFFIGFYDTKLMLAVYASFLLVAFLPKILKGNSVLRIAGLSISCSLLYFLITNWAVWYFGTMYSADLSGFVAIYVAGIPFLKNALIGDLWYTFALFGAYEVSAVVAEQRKLAKVQA